MSEAERAAARELFRQGDELQRASKFVEALDRFQRAQQVHAAPTNLLRIAECDAAIGRLVESAETYRAVLRTPLAGGSAPPAFQAAVDQARAELEQVAPRVPKLVVEVQAPAGAGNLQLQIDGQSVPAALIGEPIPLDPGMHKVLVSAAGFGAPEEQVELKEQQTKTVSLSLKAIPGAAVAPATDGAATAGATAATAPVAAAPPAATGAGGEAAVPPALKRSRSSLLLGAHLGFEIGSGKLPGAAGEGTNESIDISTVGAGGLAYGLDGGLRFAGPWFVGATLEHAQFGGATPSKLATVQGEPVQKASSNTSLLAAVLGIIVNPDRPSLYAELGVGGRWFGYSEGGSAEHGYFAGEVALGAGVWLPFGGAWRALPKITGGFGAFSPPSGPSGTTTTTPTSQTFGFVTLGLTVFYNADL
ncbi:MAG: tetratricopeptide repeat protein [Polyangiaceae bacterium]